MKKKFKRHQKVTKRNWKLKKIEGIQDGVEKKRDDLTKEEQQYEQFMRELEEDRDMRAQIDLFKAVTIDSVDEETDEEIIDNIPVEELLGIE